MKLSAVIKWAILLALLVAVASGGTLCWFWLNSEKLVHDAVADAFRNKAPGWDIRFERTRFEKPDKLHIYNFEARLDNDETPLVRVPELTARIDRNEFVNTQQVVIRSVRVRKPVIRLARDENGSWTWQQLPPMKPSGKPLPEWIIEDAQLDISLDYGPAFPIAQFTLTGGNAKLLPTSQRSFDFNGNLNIENAGNLNVAGGLNLEHSTWHLAGQMNEVVAGERLVQLASRSSPRVRERLASLQHDVSQAAERLRGENIRLASADTSMIGTRSPTAPAFGIAGMMDLQFHVNSRGPGTEPNFRVLLGLKDGTLKNDALPFPLHSVDAQVYRDNNVTTVRIRNASNDQTQLNLDASIRQNPNGPLVGAVKADIRDLPLDGRIWTSLPLGVRRLLRPLNVHGLLSIKGDFHTQDGQWVPEQCRVDVRNGSCLYEKFQYPVAGVTGSVVQRGDSKLFDVDLRGEALQHPVTLRGTVNNPGPTAESRLIIGYEDVPLDNSFRAALDAKGQEIFESLDMRGVASGIVKIYRAPKAGEKPVFAIITDVTDGSMNYERFPYQLRDLTGHVTYASHSRNWTFTKLTARHGETRLAGDGWYKGESTPDRFHLSMTVNDATLTNDLRAALGEEQQDLWDYLSPTGTFDMQCQIDWVARQGQSALVTIPALRLRNGSLRPDCFPYQLNDVAARLSYAPQLQGTPDTGAVTIHQVVGRHGNTTVDAAGWAKHKTNGDWTMHFDKLDADRVTADSDFRRALPDGLRDAIEALNPTEEFRMENTELEFRGATEDVPVTAAWYTETVLNGGNISAGMDLHNVHGRVTNRGTYGPEGLTNQGEVVLSSAEVLDHKLTNIRGPYRVKDTQLWIGAPEVFTQQPGSVPFTKRITADAFGGQLSCDARVNLDDQNAYQVFATLKDSDLRTYARIHMPGEHLAGKMNGWIHLHGAGPEEAAIAGDGQLQISPAAIYEMPVMVNMLQALSTLNFTVQDRVMFRHALLNFRVRDRNFLFDNIDLVGKAINFRGRGRVDFDSRVKLSFYSKPPRSRSIISKVISGVTSTWVNVEVGGTLDRPRTRVQPNSNLDEALEPFLQQFDPTTAPRIQIPFAGRRFER